MSTQVITLTIVMQNGSVIPTQTKDFFTDRISGLTSNPTGGSIFSYSEMSTAYSQIDSYVVLEDVSQIGSTISYNVGELSLVNLEPTGTDSTTGKHLSINTVVNATTQAGGNSFVLPSLVDQSGVIYVSNLTGAYIQVHVDQFSTNEISLNSINNTVNTITQNKNTVCKYTAIRDSNVWIKEDVILDERPALKYKVYLTQSGTNNPSATVLDVNCSTSIEGITWTRTGEGIYQLTHNINNLYFTNGNCFVSIAMNGGLSTVVATTSGSNFILENYISGVLHDNIAGCWLCIDIYSFV